MLWEQFLRNIGAVGSTDVNIKAEFDTQLGQTYQLMLAKLKNYKTTTSATFSTVANQDQLYNYPYPEGSVDVDGIWITVGSVNFPLRPLNAEMSWEQLNAILIQASALPQYYLPRRDGFGIWPIPQAVYTGTIVYHYRDRNLSVPDYITGTVTVTPNSAIVTGVATVWTPAMVGRWFTVTDPTVSGQGYWYRVVGYTSPTQLTLYQPWSGSAGVTTGYRVGETPEIPEEGHSTLVDGVTAEFYANMRKDLGNSAIFFNKFWTGDPNNKNRQEGNSQISAGLIGLMNRYANRQDQRIIDRVPKLNPLQYKVWATSLS